MGWKEVFEMGENKNELGEKIREYYSLSVFPDPEIFFKSFRLTDSELEFLEKLLFPCSCHIPNQKDTSVIWVAAVEFYCLNGIRENLEKVLFNLNLDLNRTLVVFGMLSEKSLKNVSEILNPDVSVDH